MTKDDTDNVTFYQSNESALNILYLEKDHFIELNLMIL